MDKILKEKLNRWITFSEAIKKLYLRLITCEQNNNFGEEYQNIIYILPSALDIEDKIIHELNINERNWRDIKRLIDCDDELSIKIMNEASTSIDALRRSNRLDDILLYDYNNFLSDGPITNVIDLITRTNYQDELNNLKYADAFLKHVTINFIAMLEKYIYEVTDPEIKDYLIYIKYALICMTPNYERSFVELRGQTLPTININTNFPEIDGFDDEAINELNRYNLKNSFKDDLIQAFCVDNEDMFESFEKKVVYRILALNKARLISFRSDTFISELESMIEEIKPTSDEYSIVNKLVEEMFKDAHELVKKDYYIAKKVRN